MNILSERNVRWIGDLSLEDAEVLATYSMKAAQILEFGAGGSTQIFAQCIKQRSTSRVISVETDPAWITLTQSRINELKAITPVQFISYEEIETVTKDLKFDLILVDGIDYLRREFGINSWKLLADDGVMVFHDTRRFPDFQNAAWVAQLYFNEIKQIEVNVAANSNGKASNITIIHKKLAAPYVNWNYTENKPLWSYGMPGQPTDQQLWSLNNA